METSVAIHTDHGKIPVLGIFSISHSNCPYIHIFFVIFSIFLDNWYFLFAYWPFMYYYLSKICVQIFGWFLLCGFFLIEVKWREKKKNNLQTNILIMMSLEWHRNVIGMSMSIPDIHGNVNSKYVNKYILSLMKSNSKENINLLHPILLASSLPFFCIPLYICVCVCVHI